MICVADAEVKASRKRYFLPFYSTALYREELGITRVDSNVFWYLIFGALLKVRSWLDKILIGRFSIEETRSQFHPSCMVDAMPRATICVLVSKYTGAWWVGHMSRD